MKILIVTTKSPYPLFEGRALRTYNLLKQAAGEHEIHLLSFVQTQEDLDGIEHMRSICKVVEYEKLYFGGAKMQILKDAVCELFSAAPLPIIKYRTAGMRARLKRLMAEHHYDLVHLDMLHLGEYIDLCGNTPVVLIEHNVEHVILDRRADNETRPLHRAYLRYQARKLKSYEASACLRADHVVAVSELDAQHLRDIAPGAQVSTVPNGVNTSYFAAQDTPIKPHNLVFVGGFTWFPNLDAIRYFCEDILPLLVKAVPDLRLTVIGKQPDTPVVDEIARHPHVHLTGQVDDIRPYVDEAAAYIVPLRIGGGTRLKILDALSMGKAIISTSVGCEGLAVEDGQTIVIADTPETFSQAIVRVLNNPDEARAIGQRGRTLVEQRYDWAAVAKGLMAIYAQTVTLHRQQTKAA
ncbi:MAG: glycosyltransferase family 4 protein [Aquabacterium sp.]|nr:glycosyltransferase family 4 protein [Aquabacterium sp.]